ncbi:MAG TPA: DUF5666 domain-containing protein [Candidatus Cybelea sp.]|nr:DUF5666 domain-containing protein [Candidatus Cybelea sp.]
MSCSPKIAAVALCCFCSAIPATTRPANACSFSGKQAASVTQTGQVQSVAGRIRSVEGNTFTLETIKSHAFAGQEEKEKGMTFTVDQNTAIEGRIEVGLNVEVRHRKTNGNNIALSVRVTPEP